MATIVASGGSATANTYPARPLQMLVPFSAGNAVDLLVRAFAEPLKEELGQAVVVRPESPHRTLGDLIAAARHRPGKVSFGLSGIGSIPHLQFHMVAARAQAEFNVVAYRNYGLVVPDVLSGQLDFAVMVFGSFQRPPMRILAALSEKRSPLFPDVPSSTELGFPAQTAAFGGLHASVATPKEILGRLESARERVAKTAAYLGLVRRVGSDFTYLGSAAFAQRLAADSRDKAEAVKLLKLQVE